MTRTCDHLCDKMWNRLCKESINVSAFKIVVSVSLSSLHFPLFLQIPRVMSTIENFVIFYIDVCDSNGGWPRPKDPLFIQ